MGRRRREQDTANVVNAVPAAESQEPQLQVTPAPMQTVVEQPETNSVVKSVEEIPYEDRPIPEAYFPPEEETPEFIPEPHIQQTVPQTPAYRIVSDREIDALKFSVKPVEKTKTEDKNADATTIADIKEDDAKKQNAEIQSKETQANQPSVAANNIDFASLKFDQYIKTAKTDTSKHINSNNAIAEQTKSDSLTAINTIVSKDSLSIDSLAKDSVAFNPVEKPEVKREIVSIDGKELPETVNTMWWYTPILIAFFIAYLVIFKDRKKAIFSEVMSFIKPTTEGSIFGLQWLQNSKYKFVLSSLGVISCSLFLFLANKPILSASWIFFLAVTIFVVGKKLVLSLLEYIYFEGSDRERMSSAFMVLVRQTGLFLVPSVLGLSFAPEAYRHIFTYFGIFIVGLAIFAFNFKVFVNFLRGFTSIFYLILYLCTLEVIPVAIFFVLGLLPRL